MDKAMEKNNQKPADKGVVGGAMKMQPPGGKTIEADPKMVEAFQKLVKGVGIALYQDPARTAQILEVVKGFGKNTVAGVAQATLVILDQLREKVQGVHPNFVYAAVPVTSLMIFELAEQAGSVQFSNEMWQKCIGMIQEKLKARLGAGGEQPEQAGGDPAASAGAPASADGDAPRGEMPVGGDEQPDEALDEEDEEAEA